MRGYKGVEKFPHLEMSCDLNFWCYGDTTLEFGDVTFDVVYYRRIIGKTKIPNFTISPGQNTYRGACDLHPLSPSVNDYYYRNPILSNLISGTRSNVTLVGTFEPLGFKFGTHRGTNFGLPVDFRSPRHVLIDSIELTVNRDLRPIVIDVTIMNPFHTEMAVTYFDGNITGTVFSGADSSVEIQDRNLATITKHTIADKLIPSINGNEISIVTLTGIEVDPTIVSHLTREDVFGDKTLDITVSVWLGLDIGGYTAMIPYFAMGRKTVHKTIGNGGGSFKIVFVGGVTLKEMMGII
ncbi:hypothetical protein BDZ91DRAFT_741228 [Kalaharituber pfeilii]|nr:hypothetical protein BDZ91DRAFT_741228 [Kalaharituber pfeilii]